MTLKKDDYLVEIKHWVITKGHERDSSGDWEWPAPPIYTEYEVIGSMRDDIIKASEVDPVTVEKVRLILGCVEGGWSEYTAEYDYPIDVFVDLPEGPKKVFGDENAGYTEDGALATFLKWLDSALTNRQEIATIQVDDDVYWKRDDVIAGMRKLALAMKSEAVRVVAEKLAEVK